MKTAPTKTKNGSNGHASAEEQILNHIDSGGEFEPMRAKPKASAGSTKIDIPALSKAIVTLTIKGEVPLIVHRFGQKPIQMMLAKHMGEAQQKRDKKVPENDFLESLHWFGKAPKLKRTKTKDTDPVHVFRGEYISAVGSRWGFPAGGIREAAISACRQIEGLKMTFARGVFFVLPDDHQKNLVEIFGTPIMRCDVARNSNGQPDIRFRAEFTEWSAKLQIEHDTKCITPSQVANLLNQAGFSCGLGDWRPERGGSFGRFAVVGTDEMIIRGRA